ncbi:hypothetical protein Gbth_002_047 [Gluconobacter thailandicus F149-1 = NBRC 100600]|nr:hypothetical protein Gbth_002_047 [Gluconobacter thailandicus F149-1 = NBRC 100600]GEL86351.1 hypothetical protein GTH01_07090 [Gluconobacter thailandicus F149-1 = NBRC 100600]
MTTPQIVWPSSVLKFVAEEDRISSENGKFPIWAEKTGPHCAISVGVSLLAEIVSTAAEGELLRVQASLRAGR